MVLELRERDLRNEAMMQMMLARQESQQHEMNRLTSKGHYSPRSVSSSMATPVKQVKRSKPTCDCGQPADGAQEVQLFPLVGGANGQCQ